MMFVTLHTFFLSLQILKRSSAICEDFLFSMARLMIKHALRFLIFLCFLSTKYNPRKMFID